jgi:hypothetical protein
MWNKAKNAADVLEDEDARCVEGPEWIPGPPIL